ncbi:glycine, alanine and asparagine-rich protein [Spatholobus suberectus]|nr:glycine, alanine and asparagine-rich protein [Spatholobus suberectus]
MEGIIVGIEGMFGNEAAGSGGIDDGMVGMLGSGGRVVGCGSVGIVGKGGRFGIEGKGGNVGLGKFGTAGNCLTLQMEVTKLSSLPSNADRSVDQQRF